ncbi:MAG TPA: hypothetical protein VK485_11415 [Sphingomicrobium sp.]|nr:hypothetical protein [Sphingomicrobium sp.]
MIKSRSAAALCAFVALAGCSKSLEVKSITDAGPREGIGYVLPFTQYAMAVTWRLDYCPEGNQLSTVGEEKAKIAVKVDAASGSADDKNLAFMINPQDLQSITSVTTFSAKWHEGRNVLSTINASVEDRSAQIVGNLVKTAIKVMPMLGAPGGPALDESGKPKLAPMPCADDMSKKLKAAKTAKGRLDAENDLVEGATGAVKERGDQITLMGALIDEGSKKKLADAIEVLANAKARQTAAAEALTNALKPISFSRKFLWPLDSNTFRHGPVTIDPNVLSSWIHGGRADPVFLQIERIGTFGRETDGNAPNPVPAATVKGLRYRMPASGKLVACSVSPCASIDFDTVVASFNGPVAQLGYVNVLPFRSRAFGSNSFSAEFALDGSLKSVGYEQKTAPAEVATGALADAADQLSGVLSPTARLQASTSYLTALKARRDAVEALKPKVDDPVATEKAGLDAETSLLNARLANLQAEIALEELRAKRLQ